MAKTLHRPGRGRYVKGNIRLALESPDHEVKIELAREHPSWTGLAAYLYEALGVTDHKGDRPTAGAVAAAWLKIKQSRATQPNPQRATTREIVPRIPVPAFGYLKKKE
jgi:hypothetical protein